MYDEHWSDHAIIEKLLLDNARSEDEHLRTCPVCAAKWEEARSRRGRFITAEPEIPEFLLAKQRRAIQDRLKRPSPRRKLIPALAAAALATLVMLALFRQPEPPPPQPIQESASDSAIFEDVFRISSSTELSSVGPVKSLFEVQQ
jgi:hypothetical protein